MFLLDTNVISETFRDRRNPHVEAWFAVRSRDEIFVSAVSKAELLVGLAKMPAGRRKLELAGVIWKFLTNEIRTRVLEFGSREAENYADIVSVRTAIGRPISQSDAQIAAIARVSGLSMVTRNVRDFEHCGVDIVNPWDTVT